MQLPWSDIRMTLTAEAFQHALLSWFDLHGRKDLPWQLTPTPYRVWVAEIMLQQTQVKTVIPYYLGFMERFPDVATLAHAEQDAVLGLWSGLGYYARARHLHAAARQIVERFAGRLPDDLEHLASLPGIGRSTAGAILSMGYGCRASILDGNVKRVLCRYAEIDGWPGDPAVSRSLWHLAESLTPSHRVRDYNQAMMDLGALVCVKRQPACAACPLETACAARQNQRVEALPKARTRTPLPSRACFMLVMTTAAREVYLEQNPPSGLWGGLWVFPEFESRHELECWCLEHGLDQTRLASLPPRRHSFSHYHLDYTPVLLNGVSRPTTVREAHQGWFRVDDTLAIPTPVRRLLDEHPDFTPLLA